MSRDLRHQVLTYLQQHHVMTLATTGPEGPWAAAVFYVNDADFNLYFLSAPTSRHSRNLAAQPAVAATIQEDYQSWTDIKGIQLEGQVTRLTGPAQAAALRRYGQKFPLVGQLDQAPAEIVKAIQKIAWYRLSPSRLYFIDNAVAFGHRAEVSL